MRSGATAAGASAYTLGKKPIHHESRHHQPDRTRYRTIIFRRLQPFPGFPTRRGQTGTRRGTEVPSPPTVPGSMAPTKTRIGAQTGHDSRGAAGAGRHDCPSGRKQRGGAGRASGPTAVDRREGTGERWSIHGRGGTEADVRGVPRVLPCTGGDRAGRGRVSPPRAIGGKRTTARSARRPLWITRGRTGRAS